MQKKQSPLHLQMVLPEIQQIVKQEQAAQQHQKRRMERPAEPQESSEHFESRQNRLVHVLYAHTLIHHPYLAQELGQQQAHPNLQIEEQAQRLAHQSPNLANSVQALLQLQQAPERQNRPS
jgi:hypothetical protein